MRCVLKKKKMKLYYIHLYIHGLPLVKKNKKYK